VQQKLTGSQFSLIIIIIIIIIMFFIFEKLT